MTLRRALALIPALLLLAAAGAAPAQARVFLTVPEALAKVFPDSAAVETLTVFLDAEELAAANALAGEGCESDRRVHTVYVGRAGERVLGTAWLDTHRVRTVSESVLFLVSEGGTVARAEILRFDEPPEYLAPPRWLAQFEGLPLDGRLQLKSGLHGIAGATLTARAVTRAARRVLALHRVFAARQAGGEPARAPSAAGPGAP